MSPLLVSILYDHVPFPSCKLVRAVVDYLDCLIVIDDFCFFDGAVGNLNRAWGRMRYVNELRFDGRFQSITNASIS
jgi:hypothetical protein